MFKSNKSSCLLFSIIEFLGCADEGANENYKSSSSAGNGCEGIFIPSTHFCYAGGVYPKCNGTEYNPETHICQDSVANPAKCGEWGYNALQSGCCVSKSFSLANQRCRNDVIETKCGTTWYNSATHFCDSTVIGGWIMEKCNGNTYNPANQRCRNYTVETECGTGWYRDAYQRCGTDNVIETRCGTNDWYNPATQFCQDSTDAVLSLCGTQAYTATEQCCGNNIYTTATQFCRDGTTVRYLCDTKIYTSSQYCSNGAVKTYDGSITFDNQTYNTVVIGTQTWMAENLNYAIFGSKCRMTYNHYIDENTTDCDKYGRLYDWVTAMTLPSSCYENNCALQIQEKHQGICPVGWHIPNNEDWDKLLRYVDGTTGTESPYSSETAGTFLKAMEGWHGEDTYGFSALPGGNESGNTGNHGFWQSASNNFSCFHMYFDGFISWDCYSKTSLYSVRCLQD